MMDNEKKIAIRLALEEQAHEAIRIGYHRPISDIYPAHEIVEIFCNEKRVFIPKYERTSYEFMLMLGAIWAGGYVAGMREARSRNKKSAPCLGHDKGRSEGSNPVIDSTTSLLEKQ